MNLFDRIQNDIVSSMKARDEIRLATTRMIKTALKKYEGDTRKPLDEAAETKVLNMLRKQRLDAIEMFRKGGREELDV